MLRQILVTSMMTYEGLLENFNAIYSSLNTIIFVDVSVPKVRPIGSFRSSRLKVRRAISEYDMAQNQDYPCGEIFRHPCNSPELFFCWCFKWHSRDDSEELEWCLTPALLWDMSDVRLCVQQWACKSSFFYRSSTIVFTIFTKSITKNNLL